MTRHIHYFKTEEEFNQERNNNYVEPWVSYTEGRGTDYNYIDYTKIPFTIEALEDGDIIWELSYRPIKYSKNGGEWISETVRILTIPVEAGDEVAFMNDDEWFSSGNISQTEIRFNAKGNIMSLQDGDNFRTSKIINEEEFFSYLFKWSGIVSAENLILPATSLTESCYEFMFNYCENLINAPRILPAITLSSHCYYGMFQNCSNLINIPELPAMALSDGCYAYMFKYCIKLVNAMPILPALSLTESCYEGMFDHCTSLTIAPELPAPELNGDYCYLGMFFGCSSLTYIKALFIRKTASQPSDWWVRDVSSTGTFVKNSAAEWNEINENGIPVGWTVQTASA